MRENRLKAARERRLRLDPMQLAREQRIDLADAWERRAAEQVAVDAEIEAAVAAERLQKEKVGSKDIVRLTGVDQGTMRRLRQLATEHDRGAAERSDPCVT